MYIGIDPGLKGGIAVLDSYGELRTIFDMPLKDGKIDARWFSHVLTGNYPRSRAVFGIEKVHAMPGQGVTSMFNFGMGYGTIIGAIESTLSIKDNIIYITPQKWKKHFNLLKTPKIAGMGVVAKLYPNTKEQFYTKRGRLLDGRVDATLIARYLYETIL